MAVLGTAAAIIAIITSGAGVIVGLTNLHAQYKAVDLNVEAMIAQTELMSAAAMRLRDWLAQHREELQQGEHEIIYRSVVAMERLIGTLRRELDKTLRQRPADGSKDEKKKIGWLKRVDYLFRQQRLDRYANGIMQQVAAINLFVQTLELPDAKMRESKLRSKESSRVIYKAEKIATEILSEVSSISGAFNSEDDSTYCTSSELGNVNNFDLTSVNLKRLNLSNERESSICDIKPSKSSGKRNEKKRVSSAPANSSVDSNHPSHPRRPKNTRNRNAVTKMGVGGDGHGDSSSPTNSDSTPTPRRAGNDRGPRTPQGTPVPRRGFRDSPISPPEPSDDASSALTVSESLREEMEVLRKSILSEDSQRSRDEVFHEAMRRLQEIIQEMQRMLENGEVTHHEIEELEAQIQECFMDIRRLRHAGNTPPSSPDIHPVDEQGQTALHIAAQNLDADQIRSLIAQGADVGVRDDDGIIALHAVNYSGSGKAVQSTLSALLQAEAGIHALSLTGYTALHRVVKEAHQAAAELLIQHGADVNMRQRPTNKTPLHVACACVLTRKAKTVELLLDAGARIEDVCRRGWGPLDYALDSLRQAEQKLTTVQLEDGALGAALWDPCNRYNASIEAVDILLQHANRLHFVNASRDIFRRTYFFEQMPDFGRLDLQTARARFRNRRVEIVLMVNRDIHREVQRFPRRQ